MGELTKTATSHQRLKSGKNLSLFILCLWGDEDVFRGWGDSIVPERAVLSETCSQWKLESTNSFFFYASLNASRSFSFLLSRSFSCSLSNVLNPNTIIQFSVIRNTVSSICPLTFLHADVRPVQPVWHSAENEVSFAKQFQVRSVLSSRRFTGMTADSLKPAESAARCNRFQNTVEGTHHVTVCVARESPPKTRNFKHVDSSEARNHTNA